LKLDPGYGDAYRFIGNIMLSTENYTEAIVNYKEALRINSSQPEVYYHLGIAYFQKNNYPKAILCFQRAIEENPLYREANNYLNVAKTAQTRIDNLIGNIKASIKADTQNPILHMKLGNIYLQECIYDSALAQYQEVLSLQPQFIPAMYGLATIYSEKNEVSSAINILQKIKKIQPNNPDVYYDMACIYAKQNMTKESIGWLNQAIDKGFTNWDQIKNDPDLANIRNTSYVIGLMKNHSGQERNM
jgi:tetratricopeptide (TPR) repeat protein